VEESGKNYLTFGLKNSRMPARSILNGEYECRIDDKGRIIFPSKLKKQLSSKADGKFFINRGFERCLVLYPLDEWDRIRKQLQNINLYKRDNRQFLRYFNRGATELSLDGQNRLLLPRHLFDYAGIVKEVILCAFNDRIEIWDKPTYEKMMVDEPDKFSDLAEKVMGNLDQTEFPGDVS
jgi:MraZ protein